MTYKLTFLESAHKEWKNLPQTLQAQFKKKLSQRLENPHTPKDKLSGLQNCYKIKMKSVGYRLVYRVFDDRIVVQVIAIGKRDKSLVYMNATKRLH